MRIKIDFDDFLQPKNPKKLPNNSLACDIVKWSHVQRLYENQPIQLFHSLNIAEKTWSFQAHRGCLPLNHRRQKQRKSSRRTIRFILPLTVFQHLLKFDQCKAGFACGNIVGKHEFFDIFIQNFHWNTTKRNNQKLRNEPNFLFYHWQLIKELFKPTEVLPRLAGGPIVVIYELFDFFAKIFRQNSSKKSKYFSSSQSIKHRWFCIDSSYTDRHRMWVQLMLIKVDDWLWKFSAFLIFFSLITYGPETSGRRKFGTWSFATLPYIFSEHQKAPKNALWDITLPNRETQR